MELRDYVNVIRARWRIVVFSVAVMGLLALGISLAQPEVYEGRATVLISEGDTGAAVFGSLIPGFSSQPERDLMTQVELMQMRPLAEQTIRKLGLEESPKQLLSRLEILGEGQTNIVVVTAYAGDPEQAAAIANTMAEEYVLWSRDVRRESLTAAGDEVETRLQEARDQIVELGARIDSDGMTDDLQAELQIATGAYTTLAEKLEQLRINEQLEVGSGRIVSSAVVVEDPVSPQPIRDVALGLLAGLAIGVGLAFLYEYMDDTVKSAQELERIYGAPVLGTIPDEGPAVGSRRLTIAESPGSRPAEAYRVVRNSLDFINFEQDIHTLMISSAAPAEGKSTVAANLAYTLSQAGNKVVLVSCDFRRSTTQEFFDVHAAIGLSDVLLGAHSMKAALQRPGDEQLLIMTAGKMPPNPSELLGSTRMKELVENLEEWADWVILDTPPLLAVADPAAVARWVDVVLIVSQAGRSTRQAAQSAKDILDKVGARVGGIIAWAVSEGRAGDGYGYYVGEYQYSAYYQSETTTPVAGSQLQTGSVGQAEWAPGVSTGRRFAGCVGNVIVGLLSVGAVLAVALVIAYILDQYFGWGIAEIVLGLN